MTAQELLTSAIALFFENANRWQSDPATALVHINMVLAETFTINNRLRRKAGLNELENIPKLTQLTEQVPYEEELTRQVLPYGLAAKLYFEQEDNSRLTLFLQEYNSRLSICDRWVVSF